MPAPRRQGITRAVGPTMAALALSLSTTATGCSTAGDARSDERTVAIVSDSEIAPGVAKRLDDRDDITVVSREIHDGATMAELDPYIEPALDQRPDVLVFSGGTNDMKTGPLEMLDRLGERLDRYTKRTCVVMAVPVFRYQPGTPAEVAQRTKGTRILEDAVDGSGAKVASYLDVSIAMADRGERFFADGELGKLHPSSRAHRAIAEAIADKVARCDRRDRRRS